MKLHFSTTRRINGEIANRRKSTPSLHNEVNRHRFAILVAPEWGRLRGTSLLFRLYSLRLLA